MNDFISKNITALNSPPKFYVLLHLTLPAIGYKFCKTKLDSYESALPHQSYSTQSQLGLTTKRNRD